MSTILRCNALSSHAALHSCFFDKVCQIHTELEVTGICYYTRIFEGIENYFYYYEFEFLKNWSGGFYNILTFEMITGCPHTYMM